MVLILAQAFMSVDTNALRKPNRFIFSNVSGDFKDQPMSKGENRRKAIFEKFKDNLNLLIDNGFVTCQKDVYLCPICLQPHQDLNSNDPLTLEDVPPKSLGGSANTLTCKSCNNTAGYKIDFHLTERLREIDNGKLTPGTETSVKVNIDGEIFQGEITVADDGTMKMFHSKKNNHPEKLEKKMKQVKGGKTINMDFLKSRVIPENLEYALLKTGYLMMFEKFGYSLLLNDCFEIVRQQLRNPEERIYPEGFWFSPPYPKSMSGVYFICDKGLECFVAMFILDTGKTERMFGTLLPLPLIPIADVIMNLNKKFKAEGSQIKLTLYPMEQDVMKYLYDVQNLKAMYEWIDKRKTSANST